MINHKQKYIRIRQRDIHTNPRVRVTRKIIENYSSFFGTFEANRQYISSSVFIQGCWLYYFLRNFLLNEISLCIEEKNSCNLTKQFSECTEKWICFDVWFVNKIIGTWKKRTQTQRKQSKKKTPDFVSITNLHIVIWMCSY